MDSIDLKAACFKSCPREGASRVDPSKPWGPHVSSRAPVRGHLACEVHHKIPIKFQVVPP